MDQEENENKGFPSETPLAEMTPEQQSSYHKYQARKHEKAFKAFGDVTPAQVKQMKEELEKLRLEGLSGQEKAVEEAKKAARVEAMREANSGLLSGLIRTHLEAAIPAKEGESDDELKARRDRHSKVISTEAFLTDSGTMDVKAVMAEINEIFPVATSVSTNDGRASCPDRTEQVTEVHLKPRYPSTRKWAQPKPSVVTQLNKE